MSSHVEIIVGPMYSGKSTELIRRCSTYESIDMDVVIINHNIDTRCGEAEVSTHGKTTHNAIKTESLLDIKFDEIPNVIGIDEAQFFKDLKEFVLSLEKYKCIIIIAGLDGDYMRRPFGQILECVPLANKITKLTAMCSVCKDGTYASFTKKVDWSNEDLISIGGKEKFISVCRKHYIE